MANEVVIPPDIKPDSGEKVVLLDDQTVVFRPQFGRQWTQRNSFGDPRWVFERTYTGARSADRSRLAAALQNARGKFRVIMLSPAQEPRGTWASVAGGELLTNSDHSSVTGWTAGAEASIAVADNRLRVTRTANTGGGAAYVGQSITSATAYAPYALRFGIATVSGAASINATAATGTLYANYDTSNNVPGYRRALTIPVGTHSVFADNQGASVSLAGEYYDLGFSSYARCFLVDGGGNRLLQASTITNASWTKTNASASAVGGAGPDGVANAEALIENGSAGSHAVTQSGSRTSGAAWVTGSIDIKQRTGDRDLRLFVGNNGTDCVACTFDLSAGTAGTPSNAGATTDAQVKIVSLGNGWYRCFLTGYNPSAATIFLQANMTTNAGVTSYTGDGSSSNYMRALTAYISPKPARGAITTTTATDSSSQSGYSIYVKGLPESQSGLLLAGDWVEIDGQLKQVTASLNSNAAGLGMLEVRPQVAREVADNTPVIVTKPMGRFILANDAAWNSRYGLYADYSLKFEEVYE